MSDIPLATLVVASRPGDGEEFPNTDDGDVVRILPPIQVPSTQQVANAVLEQLAGLSDEEVKTAMEAIRKRRAIENAVTCVLMPDGSLVSNKPGRVAEAPRTCEFCDNPRMHGSMYCEKCATELKESEETANAAPQTKPILPNPRAVAEFNAHERAMANPSIIGESGMTYAQMRETALAEASERRPPMPVVSGMKGRPSEF